MDAKKRPEGRQFGLLGFLMQLMRFALATKFAELEALLQCLLIFERMVTDRLAVGAFKFDEVVL